MTQRRYSKDACEVLQEDILRSIESALARLNEFINPQLPTLNAPGLALGLTHRDQILHVCTYGLANHEAGQPVTPTTLFQIGSISKSFTSIVLLQLQEQGLLSIDDPVTKHLPWFEIQSEYEPIRLRHLMSHTAGIITGSDDTVSAYTETWNLRYTKATASPGEFFHYSNSGYKVLGLVLETLLKQPIGDILRKRILEPLGMDATVPEIKSEDRSRLASGYSAFFDDRPLPPGGLLAPATWLESDTADGSICSTAEDMCKYLRLLLQRGHGLLAQRSFTQLIEQVIATGDGTHAEHYGLGLSSQQIGGRKVIGHSGGMVGYTADMLADLDSGLGVIVLTNGPAEPSKISRYALQLARAAWCGEELPEIPLFPLQIKTDNEQVTEAVHGGERYVHNGNQGKSSIAIPVEWELYPGHYRSHNPWLSNFRIALHEGTLILIYPSGEVQPLHSLKPGHFRVGGDARSPEFIRFDVVIDGKAMQANLSGGAYSRTFTA